MIPRIVALAGLAGAGKDTVASVLATHCGFAALAFADPLRQEICQGYDLRADEATLLTNRALKQQPTGRLALIECRDNGFVGAVLQAMISSGETVDHATLTAPRAPRTVLQWWGTQYRRAQNPGYWVHAMAQRIKSHLQDGQQRFVLSDCRFENEAAMVRRLDGHIWQVERAAARADAIEGEHHSVSDGSAFGPSQVIDNNSSLLDLRDRVLAAWWSTEAGVHIQRLEVSQCQ